MIRRISHGDRSSSGFPYQKHRKKKMMVAEPARARRNTFVCFRRIYASYASVRSVKMYTKENRLGIPY